MKTFKDNGKATLMFENCNDRGFIKIYLNNKIVPKVTTYYDQEKKRAKLIAEFLYNECDILMLIQFGLLGKRNNFRRF